MPAVKIRYVSTRYLHPPSAKAIGVRVRRINAGQKSFLLAISPQIVEPVKWVRGPGTPAGPIRFVAFERRKGS